MPFGVETVRQGLNKNVFVFLVLVNNVGKPQLQMRVELFHLLVGL